MTADSLVSGVLNFRDVGGLPARGGRTRYGVLFRSGELSRVDDAGGAQLQALSLRRIVDLRADDEVHSAPSRAPEDVERVRVPLFAGSVDSFLVGSQTLDDLYRSIVDDSAARVVQAVRAVAEGGPVLVHCTVGKDRTGVTVALALAAAGVAEEAIVADYARTEALLPAARNQAVLRYLQRALPHATTLEELTARSPAVVMRRLFADLTVRFGGPVDYLLAHGLERDAVHALRVGLLDLDE